MFLIYTTLPNKESALKMGEVLLSKKLICCSNIFSVTSQYFWEDKLTTDDEYAAYFKTDSKNLDEAVLCIEENHPYEVPLIARREIMMNENYESWADGILK